MAVLVFANGDMETTEWVEPFLEDAAAIIAADGGTRYVLALGSRPDIIIGDLDSLADEMHAELQGTETDFMEYPTAKDETDLELALLYAVDHYDAPVLVFGGLGGRLDQMFANILLLMHPLLRTRSIRYVTQHQQIWLLNTEAGSAAETEVRGAAGDTVSLIPLGGDVHLEMTEGLQWPLHDERLSFGPARGLSNIMTADTARVKVKAGYLLVVHTKQLWKR